jgi:hypothetical protein
VQGVHGDLSGQARSFCRQGLRDELFAFRCPILPIDGNEHWTLFAGLTDIPFCDEAATFATGGPPFDASFRRLEAAVAVFLLGSNYDERAGELAELAAGQNGKPWLVWCSPTVEQGAEANQVGLSAYLEQVCRGGRAVQRDLPSQSLILATHARLRDHSSLCSAMMRAPRLLRRTYAPQEDVMNRTQKLMAGVAAAMAMFGSKDVLLAAWTMEARGEQTAAGSKKAPPDNSPSAAAAAILPKLDVLQSKALTVDDLHKRLPDMDVKTITAGLDRLKYDGKIRSIGRGTDEDPYKYYLYTAGGGG